MTPTPEQIPDAFTEWIKGNTPVVNSGLSPLDTANELGKQSGWQAGAIDAYRHLSPEVAALRAQITELINEVALNSEAAAANLSTPPPPQTYPRWVAVVDDMPVQTNDEYYLRWPTPEGWDRLVAFYDHSEKEFYVVRENCSMRYLPLHEYPCLEWLSDDPAPIQGGEKEEAYMDLYKAIMAYGCFVPAWIERLLEAKAFSATQSIGDKPDLEDGMRSLTNFEAEVLDGTFKRLSKPKAGENQKAAKYIPIKHCGAAMENLIGCEAQCDVCAKKYGPFSDGECPECANVRHGAREMQKYLTDETKALEAEIFSLKDRLNSKEAEVSAAYENNHTLAERALEYQHEIFLLKEQPPAPVPDVLAILQWAVDNEIRKFQGHWISKYNVAYTDQAIVEKLLNLNADKK